MKNKLFKIFVLFFETGLLYVIFNFNISCFFKENFGIRCFGCGLTRALFSILNLDFIGALKYNIMSIPIFSVIFIINFLLIYDIIFDQNKSWIFLERISRKYILIVILMIITIIINNVNKI